MDAEHLKKERKKRENWYAIASVQVYYSTDKTRLKTVLWTGVLVCVWMDLLSDTCQLPFSLFREKKYGGKL